MKLKTNILESKANIYLLIHVIQNNDYQRYHFYYKKIIAPMKTNNNIKTVSDVYTFQISKAKMSFLCLISFSKVCENFCSLKKVGLSNNSSKCATF